MTNQVFAGIKDSLIKNITNSKTIFVFATNESKRSWTDWLLTEGVKETGIQIIEESRFITFKNFKETYLDQKPENLSPVNSDITRLFVSNLIEENKTKKFLKSVINPEYAEFGVSSVDWLCTVLPSLKLWKTALGKRKDYNPDAEEKREDEDLELLYERYSSFLSENNLYEPVWCNLELKEKDLQFILFYPEQINNFDEYKDCLAPVVKSGQCKIINLPENIPDAVVKNYNLSGYNSVRLEIRQAVLKIKEILSSEKMNPKAYRQIALVIPDNDLQTLLPYVERELDHHYIPYSVSTEQSFSHTKEFSFISQIYNCVKENFDVDYFSDFLTANSEIWNFESREIFEKIIGYGKRRNCLFNYGNTDVWLASLPDSCTFKYSELKEILTDIYKADSYQKLFSKLTVLIEKYFRKTKVEKPYDHYELLLSENFQTCMDKLSQLNQFSEMLSATEVEDGFYLNSLINFLSLLSISIRKSNNGISVLKYSDGVDACYKYKFVINSSQNSIDLTYRPLGFLKDSKREKLLGENPDNIDISEKVIKLYSQSCIDSGYTQFSVAEDTFNGFAIPHISFKQHKLNGEEKAAFISEIENLNKTDMSFDNGVMSDLLMKGFENWKENYVPSGSAGQDEIISSSIYKKLREKEPANIKAVKISQSDLRTFFPCPRNWLFNNYFRLKTTEDGTSLLENTDVGTINHEILSKFLKEFISSRKPLPVTNEDSTFGNDETNIRTKISKFADEVFNDTDNPYAQCKQTLESLIAQKESFVDGIMNFLHRFCKAENFGGWNVESSEKRYSGKENKAGKEDIPYLLFGDMDCVLRHKVDGKEKYSIVDFKNTEHACPKESETTIDNDPNQLLQDFQAATYVRLWQENQGKTDSLEKMFFMAIRDEKITKTINPDAQDRKGEKHIKNEEEFKNTLEKYSEYAQYFANNLKDFKPTESDADKKIQVNSETTCSDCKWKGICRTTYTAAGKQL